MWRLRTPRTESSTSLTTRDCCPAQYGGCRFADRRVAPEVHNELLAAGHRDPQCEEARQPGDPRGSGLDPLLVTPAHPDYPSGDCAYEGAAIRVLQLFFGTDQTKASYTYPPNATHSGG